MPEPSPGTDGRSWRNAAGAWLGIGTAPGALVLGAQVGGRHGGDLPVQVMLLGGLLMAALLAAQGRLGLCPPVGESAALAQLAPRYFAPAAQRALTGLLAAAMVGWFGFNLGLGGAAAAALTGLPGPAGAALLAAPTLAVLLAGGRRWNAIAIATTLSAIALIAIVAVRLAPAEPPITFARGGLATDLAGYIGYVSVFAVRAPDFTVGLRGRRDLAWCVALLVGPALAATLVGAGVAAASGSTDVVAVLAGPGGLPVANLFVAAAVIAPTLAATHSGVLALQSLLPAQRTRPALRHGPSYRQAVLAIAVPGLVLAVLRVDRLLLDWLTLLAATLPALIPPVAAEAARRNRARARATPAPTTPARATPAEVEGRLVPVWTWAVASGVALALTAAGWKAGAVAGLGISVGATALWIWRAGRSVK